MPAAVFLKDKDKNLIISKMGKLVEIRPLEQKRFHGKAGKDSITCTKRVAALVDPVTMKYSTGLTDEDKEWLLKRVPNLDLSDNYKPGEPHPYWDDYRSALVLENNTMILDADKPMEFLKIKLAKASKYVANSMEEYNNGHFPDATHVIYDEQEEVQEKATKAAVIKKIFAKLDKMSLEHKQNVLTIATNRSYTKNSSDYVEAELFDVVNAEPQKLSLILDYKKEDLTLRALIIEGLMKRRIYKEGHKIKYQDHTIGTDPETVVQYLKDPENQDLKLRIINDVKLSK